MRTARLLALAVLAATALAGCQGEDAPTPAPVPSKSVTPTATPSPTPEATPNAASAEAFVRDYFKVLNGAIASGDTAPLRALAGANCNSCSAFAQNVERVYGPGGSIDSNGWKVRAVQGVFPGPDTTFAVELRMRLTKELVTRTPGAEPEVHAATNNRMRATVHWKASHWVMQELELLT